MSIERPRPSGALKLSCAPDGVTSTRRPTRSTAIAIGPRLAPPEIAAISSAALPARPALMYTSSISTIPPMSMSSGKVSSIIPGVLPMPPCSSSPRPARADTASWNGACSSGGSSFWMSESPSEESTLICASRRSTAAPICDTLTSGWPLAFRSLRSKKTSPPARPIVSGPLMSADWSLFPSIAPSPTAVRPGSSCGIWPGRVSISQSVTPASGSSSQSAWPKLIVTVTSPASMSCAPLSRSPLRPAPSSTMAMSSVPRLTAPAASASTAPSASASSGGCCLARCGVPCDGSGTSRPELSSTRRAVGPPAQSASSSTEPVAFRPSIATSGTPHPAMSPSAPSGVNVTPGVGANSNPMSARRAAPSGRSAAVRRSLATPSSASGVRNASSPSGASPSASSSTRPASKPARAWSTTSGPTARPSTFTITAGVPSATVTVTVPLAGAGSGAVQLMRSPSATGLPPIGIERSGGGPNSPTIRPAIAAGSFSSFSIQPGCSILARFATRAGSSKPCASRP